MYRWILHPGLQAVSVQVGKDNIDDIRKLCPHTELEKDYESGPTYCIISTDDGHVRVNEGEHILLFRDKLKKMTTAEIREYFASIGPGPRD